MKRVGWSCVAMSAAWIGLLAGCAPQGDEPKRGLTAGSRLRVAEAAEASGDRQTALSMYAAAANDAPDDTQTQLRSAEGLARNGGVEGAAALLTHRLKATPRDADLMRTLGAIQVMAGEPARAIRTLSDVLATKPNDAQALVNKAVALDILHKHDEAQELYRKALVQLPDDLTISNDLALSLMLSGHPEEARLTMLPFRDATSLPERVRINLGILDAATGHPAEARQLLGTRIGSGDLVSLTRAISTQEGSFQPDGGRRIVSRGAFTEPVVPHAEPVVVRAGPVPLHADPAVFLVEPVAAAADRVARREEPVVAQRPLQGQLAASAMLRAGPALQPVADAKPAPPSAVPAAASVPVVSSVPRPSLPAAPAETATPRGANMEARGPLPEDLVPRGARAAPVAPDSMPRSPVQEPLAVPAETAVHANMPAQL